MTATLDAPRHRFAPPPGLGPYAAGNLVATVGTGITLTASVFYFVLVGNVAASTVAFAMSFGAIVGLAAMPIVGKLAGRWGAKPVYLVLLGAQAIALVSWQLARAEPAVFACLTASLVAERGINAVVGGFIAELDMPAAARATGRAYLRSLTNVGLAVGGGIAAIALWQGSDAALRALLVVAAVMPVVAAVLVARTPATRIPRPTVGADQSGRRAVARPFRDRRFVTLAATNGVLAVHLDLLAIGLPLVLTMNDVLPPWLGGAAIATSAVLVVLFQVPTTSWVQSIGPFRGVVIATGALTLAVALLGSAAQAAVLVGVVLIGLWIAFNTVAELSQSAVEFIVSYDAAPDWAHSEYQAAYAFGRGLVRAAAPATLALVATHGTAAWLVLAAGCGSAGLVHARLARQVSRHG